MCGMCESHVNDAVRAAFPTVKKVSSSHGAGKTVIVIEEDIPDEKIREVIDKTGYTVTGITRKPYEKKGFFSRLKKTDPSDKTHKKAVQCQNQELCSLLFLDGQGDFPIL